MLPWCRQGRLRQVRQQLFFEISHKDFATDTHEADGLELP